MRTASIFINVVKFVTTFAIVIKHFHVDGAWQFCKGLKQFRYFTVLSNCLCAAGALLMIIGQIKGDVTPPIFMVKYMGTVSVTVTILTVFLFLAPSQGGLKDLISGDFFYMHLIGPLLAILSFCLLERQRMSFGTAMAGIVPMLLYGAVYLYKVILAPEDQRWEDFYGFNKGGMWPIACVVMAVGAAIVCALFWLICRV